MSKISYTKEEILNKLNEITKLSEIYNSDIINYRGNTKDTNEKYTEVIAEELLNNHQKYDFNSIETIKRERPYNIEHTGEYDEESSRREELIAMKMYNNKCSYKELGEIINYQVPLKATQETKAGKIDMISYNSDTNILYLIELKNDKSNETLLRCVLEIITYLKQVDTNKLKSEYELSEDTIIKPAILIFEQTRPYDDLNDRYVNMLIDKFNIDVFTATSRQEEVFYIEKNKNTYFNFN